MAVQVAAGTEPAAMQPMEVLIQMGIAVSRTQNELQLCSPSAIIPDDLKELENKGKVSCARSCSASRKEWHSVAPSGTMGG